MPLPAGFIPDQTPPGFIPNGPVPQAPGSVPSGFVPDTPSTQDMTPAQVEAEIRRQAQTMGLDPNVAAQVGKFESGYRTTATSPKGAYGPMQVMQNSAGGMDIRNPHQNITRGLQLWQDALRRANGDYRRAYSQYYNPGYVGAGPFGAATPPPAPPASNPKKPLSFAERVNLANAAKAAQAHSGGGGFGQFRNLLTQGINKVGDIARGIGQAEESVQNYWRTHPITLPLPGGHGIQITPQFAPPRGVNPEAIFPNPLDIATTPGALRLSPAAEAEVAAERAGIRTGAMSDLPTQNVRQQQLPLTMTRPLSIPQTKNVTKLLGSPETRQQLLLRLERERRMGLPAGHVPGQQPLGVSFTKPAARIPKPEIIAPQQTFHTVVQRALPGMTVEEPVFPRRLLIRQPETPAPAAAPAAAHAPAAEPPMPTPPRTGNVRAAIAQAVTADDKYHATQSHLNAVRWNNLRILRETEISPAQEQEITSLLHDPAKNPLVTGQWPGWVTPQYRETLTNRYREWIDKWNAVRGDPDYVSSYELANGHKPEIALDRTGNPIFPRMNLQHALESENVAGLRYAPGGEGPRRFWMAGNRMVAVKNGTMIDVKTGEAVGSTARPAPGVPFRMNDGATGSLRQITAEEARSTPQTAIIEDPNYVLNQKLLELERAQVAKAWKDDLRSGRYPELVQSADVAPGDWPLAPELGKGFKVHPFLRKILDRTAIIKDPERRWNVINHTVIGSWFRVFPYGHNWNIGGDYWADRMAFELTGAHVSADISKRATQEVNMYGPEVMELLENGGAPQYVQIESKRALQQVMQKLGQTPDVKQGPLGRVWERTGDWQERIPWRADILARTKLYMALKANGLPPAEAARQVNLLLANYWLPSFYASKVPKLQPIFNVAHDIFTSKFMMFSPYHGSRLGSTVRLLRGQAGIRGELALAGNLLSNVILRKVGPAIGAAVATYYANKAKNALTKNDKQQAEYQAQRAKRLHLVPPGRSGLLESEQTAVGLPLHALEIGGLPALRETIGPALGYAARPLVTLSPLTQTLATAYDLYSGQQAPQAGMLLPLNVQGAVGDIQRGSTRQLAEDTATSLASRLVRMNPRYYLPSEFIAHRYAMNLLKPGAGYTAAGRMTPQQRKQKEATLYNLNLIAGRDLAREGVLNPGITPEIYARQTTNYEVHRSIPQFIHGPKRRKPNLT